MTCSKSARLSDLWSRAAPPLVLDREEIEPWLAGETPTLSRSVNEDLRFFPVTPQMKPVYNRLDCIEPLAD
jgi:putative SOS response-associated peptidase YedK